jgi:hypothetical protein
MEPNQDPRKTLITLRIIWAALLLGQLTYLGVSMFIAGTMPQRDASMAQILWYVTIGSLIVILPAAYLLRLTIYSKGRKGDAITPQAYATGNILFWAMCEGIAMLAITTSMLNRHQGAYLMVAMIAFAVQVVNYPTGKLMRPPDDTINPMLRDRR